MAAPHQQHVRPERRVVKGPPGAKARPLETAPRSPIVHVGGGEPPSQAATGRRCHRALPGLPAGATVLAAWAVAPVVGWG